MSNSELKKLLDCMEAIQEKLSPKASIEQVILFLLVAMKEEYPLTKLAEDLDWSTVRTSRQVNALADQKYGGGQYDTGYQVLYTQEDRGNRVFKNAYLSHKGKELRDELIEGIKGSKPKK